MIHALVIGLPAPVKCSDLMRALFVSALRNATVEHGTLSQSQQARRNKKDLALLFARLKWRFFSCSASVTKIVQVVQAGTIKEGMESFRK